MSAYLEESRSGRQGTPGSAGCLGRGHQAGETLPPEVGSVSAEATQQDKLGRALPLGRVKTS